MSQVSQSVSQKNPTSAHSQQNHNDVCLSYIFTYQQLSDSTLGLAWTANVNKGKDLFNLTTFYWFLLMIIPFSVQLQFQQEINIFLIS